MLDHQTIDKHESSRRQISPTASSDGQSKRQRIGCLERITLTALNETRIWKDEEWNNNIRWIDTEKTRNGELVDVNTSNISNMYL